MGSAERRRSAPTAGSSPTDRTIAASRGRRLHEASLGLAPNLGRLRMHPPLSRFRAGMIRNVGQSRTVREA